jgi:ketosteroid isomerase-like protein
LGVFTNKKLATMIKKNRVNLLFFVFIIIFLSIISCKKTAKTSSTGDLLKTDRAFSKMSELKGMHAAFIEYIADEGVLLRNNSYPLKGKESLIDLYAGSDDSSFTLVWEPLYEQISSAGDIGYTYGIYNNTEHGSRVVSRGTYVTIWQKEEDGSWKFVLDTGTQGLPDKSE